jgi:hypothetical protein
MKASALAIVICLLSTSLSATPCEPPTPQSAQDETQKARPSGEQSLAKQDPPPAGGYQPGAGTTILAQFTKSLDVRKLKVGAEVDGYVTQDLVYEGKIIVPRDSKVVGHVTEAVASSKEQPHSRLGLLFDKVVLKHKKELKFQYPAVITALAPPIRWNLVTTTQMQDMPVQMEKGIDTGGAAVGAIVANPNLAGANMRATGTGAINPGSHGVTGINGIGLDTTNPGITVIVSSKGDIKLQFDTQMVLRVAAPLKK